MAYNFRAMDFLARLSQPAPIILDGATGTELTRRGVDTGLPLWSANALLENAAGRILQDIHLDYLSAGAEILTTNTFRVHRRALAYAGRADQALELTHRAVEIARSAIVEAGQPAPRFVAGSISTLEDCYRPDRVPPDNECRAEHSERVHHLLECGVDLFLIETMNTVREAAIAASLASITGTPVVVSFVCRADGRLLSGESLTEAVCELLPLNISAIGVNCCPAADMQLPLAELQQACGVDFPLIAYGNIGHVDDNVGWVNTDAIDPLVYAGLASTWPVRIIGGCCGTTPAHIAELRRILI
jgi:S-methylmethionine-dependent homocysteine/selenocysteine methylase